jgi:Rrf2 family protein
LDGADWQSALLGHGRCMLSLRTRYALRALGELARRWAQPRTTEQVASATGLPVPTLAKTLQLLGHAGIISTHRGAKGGVKLLREPRCISVWEVIEAVEAERPLAFGSPHEAFCPCLHRRLSAIMALAERVLRETTIAELIPVGPGQSQHHSSLDRLLEQVRQLAMGAPGVQERIPVPHADKESRKGAK